MPAISWRLTVQGVVRRSLMRVLGAVTSRIVPRCAVARTRSESDARESLPSACSIRTSGAASKTAPGRIMSVAQCLPAPISVRPARSTSGDHSRNSPRGTKTTLPTPRSAVRQAAIAAPSSSVLLTQLGVAPQSPTASSITLFSALQSSDCA